MRPSIFFNANLLLPAFTLLATLLSAQENTPTKKFRLDHISVAATTMHAAAPFASFSALFVKDYHPGIELASGFNWRSARKSDWVQTIRLGYTYHRWVQHSIVLYTDIGYRYKFPKGFSAAIKLGGGYMRAIVATEVFADGQAHGEQYTKITSGRSQAVVTAGLSVSKKINAFFNSTLFLEYQQRIQTPFIKSYVPLLPYNCMLLGFSFPFWQKRNETIAIPSYGYQLGVM
jgi:hypothetical protein